MRVLVADDDAISRRMLSASLASTGHTLEAVADGEEAWARFERGEPPELVILDWQMPGLDGPEICRRLRQRKVLRYTYVILVTSSDSPHDAAVGLEAGADDFIAKPFDPEELRARVRAGQRILELQAEMARSRAYLDAVLANIDSGVLLMNHTGRVVYGNDALVRMSGTPLDVVRKLTREDFVRLHAGHLDGPQTLVDRLGEGEMLPLDAEIDIDVTRPAQRTLRWIAKQVPLPEGPGQLDLFRDVTDEVERDREQAVS